MVIELWARRGRRAATHHPAAVVFMRVLRRGARDARVRIITSNTRSDPIEQTVMMINWEWSDAQFQRAS